MASGNLPNSPSLNSNTVPLVANGHVHVASYQGLRSFDPSNARPATQIAHPVLKNQVQLGRGGQNVFGTITAIDGSTITVKKRDWTMVSVDTTDAATSPLTLDEPVRMVGNGTDTALHAKWISRAKGPSKIWPHDR
jgi:hypothetical protein